MDERKRRIAENEARFRAINDRLEDDLRRLDVGDGPIAFVCECGQAQCTDPVEVTNEEYVSARRDRMAFFVVPGHEIPDTEDVVGGTERFNVVRKHAEAQPIVAPEGDAGGERP